MLLTLAGQMEVLFLNLRALRVSHREKSFFATKISSPFEARAAEDPVLGKDVVVFGHLTSPDVQVNSALDYPRSSYI